MAKQTEAQAELEKLAWKRWFEIDFSWEGLKTPHILETEWGPIEIKDTELQDYWRRDPETGAIRSDYELIAAGELVIQEGQKTYHIAHLPLFYDLDNTNPTIKKTQRKDTFEKLLDVICKKIESLAKEEDEIDEYGLQISLDGCVLDRMNFARKEKWSFNVTPRVEYVIFVADVSIEISSLDYFSMNNTSFLNPIHIYSKDSQKVRSDPVNLYFDNCYLVSAINCFRCQTKFEVYFDKCRVESISIYESIVSIGLDQTEITGDIELHNCESDTFYLTGGKVGGRVWVTGGTYHDSCNVEGTEFGRAVRISGAKFPISASFSNVTFHEAFSFRGCEIGRFQFTSINWPTDLTKCNRAFERCTFHDLADFTDSGIKAFGAFDSAWFEKGLRLDPLSEDLIKFAFRAELPKRDAADREDLLGQIESGCRSLRAFSAHAGSYPQLLK